MTNIAEIARALEPLRRAHVSPRWENSFRYHLDRLLEHDEEGNPKPAARRDATGETRGILVIDGPGGGKTWTVKRTLTNHPALSGGGEEAMRLVRSTVPGGATEKSMAQQLLVDSGYVIQSRRRTAWEMWRLFKDRMHAFGTVALWIDEAHDLLRREEDKVLPSIKSLMAGEGAVVVVLSGTEALAQVVRSDAQVQRRFSTIRIPPVTIDGDRADFEALIADYCARVGIRPMLSGDLFDRLAVAARHRFGRVIATVVEAIEQALLQGSQVLGAEHFADAYELKEGCPPERNVFLVPNWIGIDPDADPEAVPPIVSRRWRGRHG